MSNEVQETINERHQVYISVVNEITLLLACVCMYYNVTQTANMETMLEAGTEIHEHKGNLNADGISQCGVLCDGTWQKRGHSSMNGCVTALSMDTGKCLDVEVLTRYAMDAKDMKTNRTQEKIEYGKQSMQGNARQTILDQHHPWKLRV